MVAEIVWEVKEYDSQKKRSYKITKLCLFPIIQKYLHIQFIHLRAIRGAECA